MPSRTGTSGADGASRAWRTPCPSGATGSSLWIGSYNDTGFYKEEDFKVWYKITDKEDFVNYTKNLIEKRLNGEFD